MLWDRSLDTFVETLCVMMRVDKAVERFQFEFDLWLCDAVVRRRGDVKLRKSALVVDSKTAIEASGGSCNE